MNEFGLFDAVDLYRQEDGRSEVISWQNLTMRVSFRLNPSRLS